MKQEVKDIGFELIAKTTPAAAAAWWADWWNHVNVTAVLTAVFVGLQIVYLVRKWWREETEWGLKLRQWAGRHGMTKPAELDE